MKRKIPMTRLIITALIFGLAAILTTLAQRNAEATPPQASTEFDAIDDYVRGQLDDLRMPGAALGIVKDGEVVHLQTFRDASKDEKAVTAQTPFKIGSLSKSFTALAVMQLVEQAGSTSTHPYSNTFLSSGSPIPKHRSASPSGTY
jgi:CubicO group peptidase (beta-lactamase class C family)